MKRLNYPFSEKAVRMLKAGAVKTGLADALVTGGVASSPLLRQLLAVARFCCREASICSRRHPAAATGKSPYDKPAMTDDKGAV